ncbi:MAG: NAD(P)-dependent oxidoreductase [Myxococcota bacterium]
MKILVTGSNGHLGEALMRALAKDVHHSARGLDLWPSPYTEAVGSITDREFVREALRGVDAVAHTATLHKPHVATHSQQAFVDTNITGTLILLEEALTQGIERFVFTSTTSTFGGSLAPRPGEPAAWITEDVPCIPKNIYGATKTAAEDLCWLFHRRDGLSVVVLRTSRFFPEEDDSKAAREAYDDANLKANEFLYRRVDIEDAVSAHVQALDRSSAIGFGRYIISATTPFSKNEAAALRSDGPAVVARHAPDYVAEYARRGWRMLPSFDRVYVNQRARNELGWEPRYDFGYILKQLRDNEPMGSSLSRVVGIKGYQGPANPRD